MRFFLFTIFTSVFFFMYADGAIVLSPSQEKMLKAFTLPDAYMKAFSHDVYKICQVPSQGNFYVDTSDDIIKRNLFLGQAWEPEVDTIIYQQTKKGTIALDIGAHIGTHTLALSKAVGEDGLVIAFEPNPKIYRELCMNLKLNGCTNVIPVQCALGNQDGEIGICTPCIDNEGGTYVGAGTTMVPLRKLDDFMLRNISFIKMDAENYEDMVLAGSQETLSACKPFIFLEIQGNYEQLAASGGDQAEKTKATIQKLEAFSYKVSNFSNHDFIAVP